MEHEQYLNPRVLPTDLVQKILDLNETFSRFKSSRLESYEIENIFIESKQVIEEIQFTERLDLLIIPLEKSASLAELINNQICLLRFSPNLLDSTLSRTVETQGLQKKWTYSDYIVSLASNLLSLCDVNEITYIFCFTALNQLLALDPKSCIHFDLTYESLIDSGFLTKENKRFLEISYLKARAISDYSPLYGDSYVSESENAFFDYLDKLSISFFEKAYQKSLYLYEVEEFDKAYEVMLSSLPKLEAFAKDFKKAFQCGLFDDVQLDAFKIKLSNFYDQLSVCAQAVYDFDIEKEAREKKCLHSNIIDLSAINCITDNLQEGNLRIASGLLVVNNWKNTPYDKELIQVLNLFMKKIDTSVRKLKLPFNDERSLKRKNFFIHLLNKLLTKVRDFDVYDMKDYNQLKKIEEENISLLEILEALKPNPPHSS